MAALFTLLLGIAALLSGYFLYDFGRQNFIRESEAAIDMEMEHILAATAEMTLAQRTRYIALKAERAKHPLYLLQGTDEALLAGNIRRLPERVIRLSEGLIGFEDADTSETRDMAAKIHTFMDGSRLLIARDVSPIMASHARLKLITVLVMVFMLLVVIASFFISVFVVGRINVIASTARAIMDTGDLSQRIDVKGSWDDLSNLAQMLNRLLAQIESLMHGIRDVSDSIAHDLRTPLTRLRTQLEALQAGEAPPDAIRSLLAEADTLLSTFQALLRIANIEKAARLEQFSDVHLKDILTDVIELYEPLAEEKEVALSVELRDAPIIRGDKDLLFQAFANLLDNAIKYALPHTAISVSLRSNEEGCEVIIADRGCGVSEADMPRLFERFYRADKSRSSEGSGLGLSLVKAVMDLHKASITLKDHQPGLRIEMVFR